MHPTSIYWTGKTVIDRHDVAECNLKLKRAIAFDLADEISATSRFVIVDRFEISGGGTIREALEDQQTWVRDKVLLRDIKWEYSMLSQEERAEKYHQKSSLILITGEKDTGKKPLAKQLEAELFSEGRLVYFLGIGNVLYGVDADIKGRNDQTERTSEAIGRGGAYPDRSRGDPHRHSHRANTRGSGIDSNDDPFGQDRNHLGWGESHHGYPLRFKNRIEQRRGKNCRPHQRNASRKRHSFKINESF